MSNNAPNSFSFRWSWQFLLTAAILLGQAITHEQKLHNNTRWKIQWKKNSKSVAINHFEHDMAGEYLGISFFFLSPLSLFFNPVFFILYNLECRQVLKFGSVPSEKNRGRKWKNQNTYFLSFSMPTVFTFGIFYSLHYFFPFIYD